MKKVLQYLIKIFKYIDIKLKKWGFERKKRKENLWVKPEKKRKSLCYPKDLMFLILVLF